MTDIIRILNTILIAIIVIILIAIFINIRDIKTFIQFGNLSNSFIRNGNN